MVCASKDDGGLAVIDIKKQNEALLLKKPPQIFQQGGHSLGVTCLGKALQEWKTTKPH